jgi:two-component system OmpR family sensor kinase/two-component system sensor histidine kinase BaeS
LALAIILTTLVAVGLVALVANQVAGTEFRRYLAAGQVAQAERLAGELADYYERTGSWTGVAESLSQVQVTAGGNSQGRMRGRGATQNLVLADGDGRVIYDSQDDRLGSRLSASQLNAMLPIMVSGEAAGFLGIIPPGRAQLEGAERAFLDRINTAVLLAAGMAVLLGIGLGLLLARTLTAPLRQVSIAAEAIAAGDLSQRVPEQGTFEVRSVARSFNQMASNLEQAEQLRRNLVADIAHELRTPLTVIQGNLQALLDGVYPLERAEIATIYDETRLLSRLVADLRELAQAEAGQLHLVLQPTDVTAVAEQTVDSLAPLAEAHQVDLKLDVRPDLPPALADADRLAQILRNLLSNALRHAPKDGRVVVSIEGIEDQAWLRVAVADDGPGIPAADLPHVFDRFWSRGQGDAGSGLGLAITKHLVEAQGGQIAVQSQPGHGTQFWFTLRAVAPAEPASSPPGFRMSGKLAPPI